MALFTCVIAGRGSVVRVFVFALVRNWIYWFPRGGLIFRGNELGGLRA